MAALDLEKLAPQIKGPQPFDPAKSTAAPVAVPTAAPVAATVAPTVAPTQQPAPAAAATAFPHLADGGQAPAAGLTPKAVKTQAIHQDPAAMYNDLATASGLTAGEKPTARATAKDVLEESAKDGVTNLNQYAYELATTRRESHMGNWMNEFGGNTYFENNYF